MIHTTKKGTYQFVVNEPGRTIEVRDTSTKTASWQGNITYHNYEWVGADESYDKDEIIEMAMDHLNQKEEDELTHDA